MSSIKDGICPDSNNSNCSNYNVEYDKQLNEFIDEVAKDFLFNDNSNEEKQNDLDPEKEKFEDYYDEFHEDEEDALIPAAYEIIIKNKINKTMSRLEALSTLICYTCSSDTTINQINRIEQDHNTPFCKLDCPRHPPFSKAWQNYWRFNCNTKCKVNSSIPCHIHTDKCEITFLEHVDTKITIETANLNSNEFPSYLMHAVQLFQQFVNSNKSYESSYLKKHSLSYENHDKPIWNHIKLRSNYKNELMLIACGRNVKKLQKHLQTFFFSGPGRSCNVVSLYCVNSKSLKKKERTTPIYVEGCMKLRDKIGPITINYYPKNNIIFNSIQAELLGKVMFEYLALNMETTLIDLGCNYGVLSLMLAHKCDKVIGLYSLDHQIKMAEEIKSDNNLHNTSFIVCNPKEVHTKCSSLVKKCTTVAVLNLASPYGKSFDAIKALRDLPSIWRVAVYGSFTTEFHKFIAILTSKNESMGDEFLPMQGRILDKSPTASNEFDIVILFERKELIESSVELITSGPTLNVKTKTDNFWNSNNNVSKLDVKYAVKHEKSFDLEFDDYVKNPSYKHSNSTHSSKYEKCDNSSVLKDSNLKKKDLPLKTEKISNINNNVMIKDTKRIFDFPPLPKSPKRYLSNVPVSISKFNENEPNNFHIISIKKECKSTVLQDEDQELVNINLAKEKESSLVSDAKRNIFHEIKPEFVYLNELKATDDCQVLIKCEPLSADSNILSKHLDQVVNKTEPLSPLSEEANIKSFYEVKIKSEPISLDRNMVKMETLSTSYNEDFQNMVTPLHKPSAFTCSKEFSPLPLPSTNFTTVDGFQFSVKPNQSFLSFKHDRVDNESLPQSPTVVQKSYSRQSLESSKISELELLNVKVKKEDPDCADFIIKEKVDKANNAEMKENKVKLKKERKKKIDEVKEETTGNMDADLRTLIIKRKSIQKQLDRDRKYRKVKRRYNRSPSPFIKRFRSTSSPPNRDFNLSPSRYKSSLPPKKISDRRSRSPLSPNRISNRRMKSPLSPNRISNRRSRSPISPKRFSDKKYRSPFSTNRIFDRRYRSSLSPKRIYEKRCRLSSSPNRIPDRRYRSAPIPNKFIDQRCKSPNIFTGNLQLSPRCKRSPELSPKFKRSPESSPELRSKNWRDCSPTIRECYARSRSPIFSPLPSKRFSHSSYN